MTRLQPQGVPNVKKSLLVAALAAFLLVGLALAALPAAAQQPYGAPPAAPSIVLLDVTALFKAHPRYRGMMNDLKADIERAEAQVREESAKLKKLAEQLQESYRPGTPEYKSEEENLLRRQNELSIRVKLQQKEFLLRESKVHYNVYLEIIKEVQHFCQQNNITMVLRYNGEKVDPEKPEDIARLLNQPVVYHRGIDITQQIQAQIARRADPAPGPVPSPFRR
jgi:Skp family chaperone for outer membrane proteins